MASGTKSTRLQEARASLTLAQAQLEKAQNAWWAPTDVAECVTNAFYAYENAVTSAMLAVGRARSRKHFEKSKIAKQLYVDKKLKTDVSDLLNELNEARKDVQYGEAGTQLAEIDLEDLVSKLELFLEEIEQFLGDVEGTRV